MYKPMEHEIIQFVGIKELEPVDQAVVNKLSTEYYDKLKRMINTTASLKVHVKVTKVESKKKKYNMHTQLIAPSKTFTSTNAEDWDLARALHKTFQDLEHQVNHTYHADSTRPD